LQEQTDQIKVLKNHPILVFFLKAPDVFLVDGDMIISPE
jgi:hypothetical protein